MDGIPTNGSNQYAKSRELTSMEFKSVIVRTTKFKCNAMIAKRGFLTRVLYGRYPSTRNFGIKLRHPPSMPFSISPSMP